MLRPRWCADVVTLQKVEAEEASGIRCRHAAHGADETNEEAATDADR